MAPIPPIAGHQGGLVRRGFWLGLGALAVAALALLLIFLGGLGPGGSPAGGRLVDAGLVSGFQVRRPKAFPHDGFYLIRLDDGSLAAFYAYPPGYFGHAHGCQIRWDLNPDLNRTFHQNGIWSEGCSGSRWDPAGHRLSGPAPRDLDRFSVLVRNDHVLVDTRRLACAADPCQRVTEPVTEFDLTLTANGFQPARIELPAGKPGYVILKNDTDAPQNWHVLGAPNASSYAGFTPPGLGPSPPFASGSDIHTLPTPPGAQFGVPFIAARRGTYTFVSDADPAHLRGTLTVR